MAEAGLIAGIVVACSAIAAGIGALLRRLKLLSCGKCCRAECDEETKRVQRVSRAAANLARTNSEMDSDELERVFNEFRAQRAAVATVAATARSDSLTEL